MKKIIFFLFFLFSSSLSIIYSQNKLTSEVMVEYNMTLDLDNLTQYDAYLYFNSSNAYFIYKPVKGSNYSEEVQENDNETRINISDSSSIQLSIDKINNRLMETKQPALSGETYVIEESIPKVQWTLLDETKKINKLICKKAITVFRGRKYEVWYCPDLPFNYGPWKLSGLPGLILEAADDMRQVVFNVKKIEMPYHIEMPSKLKENIKTITVAEYLKIQDNAIKDFEARMKSQSDRDMKIEVTYKLNDIEKE